ncbi:hypothetical protein SmJEL517_g05269 [Synchytrium microbalum]|uniref:PH domain-containing protein n=1 Tax=Synchytrium microbalum TaxID=1806994 RepID=A0A507BWZ4_9FUNG|nr:uncharacterized protein SmJEL517_g05269 [Synchytrium microbalum]TPX31389.1 hypothetical protein SmJEL517_g05269 [Synchytrium microbalum]
MLARKDLHRKGVEYCFKLNDVDMRRKFEIVESVTALMFNQTSFFHQGHEHMVEVQPAMRDVTGHIQNLRAEYQHQKANTDFTLVLREATSAMYNPTFKPVDVVHFWGSEEEDGKVPPLKAGYLYKKGSSKMRTVWNRRWFEILAAGSLRYVSEAKDFEHSSVDIRTCKTKEIELPDRRNCLEIVTPQKTLVLQAENEFELKDWIEALTVAATTPPGNPIVLPNAPKVAVIQTSAPTPVPSAFKTEYNNDSPTFPPIENPVAHVAVSLAPVDDADPWAKE